MSKYTYTLRPLFDTGPLRTTLETPLRRNQSFNHDEEQHHRDLLELHLAAVFSPAAVGRRRLDLSHQVNIATLDAAAAAAAAAHLLVELAREVGGEHPAARLLAKAGRISLETSSIVP